MHKYRGGTRFPLLFGNSVGYTIVEVMIFLAVSGAIFLSAVTLVSGQQGRTQFQQGMRDITSKLENSISEVKTGIYPRSGALTCTVNASGDINVNSVGPGFEQGANTACLYLGKAFQAIPNDDYLSIFTVLGTRTYTVGGNPITAKKFDDARPQAIVSPPNGVDLTETYELPYGSTVVSSKVTTIETPPANPDSSLVGFYQSLEDETIDASLVDPNNDKVINGSQSIFSRAYTGGSSNSRDGSVVSNCIRGSAGCTIKAITKWDLCIQSQTSNQRGLITVTTTLSGVSTQMTIGDCS